MFHNLTDISQVENKKNIHLESDKYTKQIRQVRTNNKGDLCASSFTGPTRAPAASFRARQKYSLATVNYQTQSAPLTRMH